MRRRILLVGRNRYRLPLDASLARKFGALAERLDVRVLASSVPGGPTGDGTFVLYPPLPRLLDGAAFWALLPLRTARELRRTRPHAILTQSPYEAAAALVARALARSRAKIVLDVHGDWRTFGRLYGSPLRRTIAPLLDRVALAALRRADAVRTISDYTTDLVRAHGVEPAAVFPAFMDLGPFLERPTRGLPERPQALFIGVLELYKNVDGLAEAWRRAAPRVPEATLRIVGVGSRTDVVEGLLRDLPEQTAWTPVLTTPEVAEALDEATVLVLPSRSEGMGRVIVEALCRGRPVVASAVGGIRDLLEDGRNALLVPPGDADALADALVRVLSDASLAARLAAAARPSVDPWLATPDDYAERLRELVERVVD